MAPRRPDKKPRRRPGLSRAVGGSSKPVAPQALVKTAEHQLEEGNIQEALDLACKALEYSDAGSDDELASVNFLGQIHLDLGEFEAARSYFMRAVALDEDGSKDEKIGGGPEKFLCLAQLSEEGGADSVSWFEQGAAALKEQIQNLEEVRRKTTEQELQIGEFKRKLAMTLCSIAEVYMTDLSWEEDAEQRCEALITEATMVAPEFAETWQTLANCRISQSRFDDAKAALTRSLELWIELPPEDPAVPDFPSRVALARLLMEVEMEQKAIEVLERLVGEDDESVEVWYLGGWGLYVMGEKQKAGDSKEEDWKASWISSRVWLNQCQHLYKLQDYEDEPLGEHAQELLGLIAQELGEAPAGEEDGEDEDWEDADDSDEEMKG
ncbi:TPR-like protein [Hypoxylon fragiforme]|uniref:TPR-like protein n=1 Tax=Hypoxylon fragiforme TaxID=63214 RepID=UPI0020C65800|nr:TPR-like protein [Hypoxylon fragiforme]KAI2607631.1 TPR-like protein [Hypoxylon fragiforme]